MPAPDDAPVPPVAHYARGRPNVIYTYRAADGLSVCAMSFCSTLFSAKRMTARTLRISQVRWLTFAILSYSRSAFLCVLKVTKNFSDGDLLVTQRI